MRLRADALIGFRDQDNRPLVTADSPEGSCIYSLIRIRGVEKPQPEVVLLNG